MLCLWRVYHVRSHKHLNSCDDLILAKDYVTELFILCAMIDSVLPGVVYMPMNYWFRDH